MTVMLDDESASFRRANAELQRRLVEALAERDEAEAQKAAMAEVMKVINASPGVLAPVFEAMLEKATHLCEAEIGVLWTYHAEQMEASAILGAPSRYAEFLRQGSRPLSPTHQRLRQGERVIQIVDVPSYEGYRAGLPLARALFDLGGVRTILMVPLRKDEAVLGAFAVYRQQVRPFSDKQIALLENFAAQAVIAMENARLITETREALEQQTATAEVLQVINSSPADLAPVFDAMLEKATRLCDAAFGGLAIFEGETYRVVAMRNIPQPLAAAWQGVLPIRPETSFGRIARGESPVHIVDISADETYRIGSPLRRAAVDLGGARTALWVALRKDGVVLGTFAAWRREVRPFSDKQIALLQNFAAQAVIAIENARLLTETREALEQQTATAEVLQVINSSPGDLGPVFDAMLEKALHLCEADLGGLYRFDGKAIHPVAARSGSKAAAEILQQSFVIESGSSVERLVRGEDEAVQVRDIVDTEAYRSGAAYRVKFVELTGARTALWVALRKDEALVGVFVIYRQEVRLFSDKQIALLQNFAAQAVIAMENARLITETREALEQQTATAEVLQVINSSPGDLAPVFDAILEKAHGLCDIAQGSLELYDGERFRAVAVRGLSDAFADMLRQGYPASDNPATRPLIEGGRFTYIRDLAETDYSITRTASETETIRTLLCVPLRRNDVLLGMIASARREVRPFSEKEIALLENFAAQAVIAMENARLITETREALEQQTATAEVLQVINSSPGDLKPVFDAIVERAMRLCEAAFGFLITVDGEDLRAVALRNVPERLAEHLKQPMRFDQVPVLAGAIQRGQVLHVNDLAASDAYRDRIPLSVAAVEFGSVRSVLYVPLTKDDRVLGVFIIFRQEVRPFSDKQIALLQNFAAQAVIAMENARLLGELRQRQAELQVTFDNMVDGVAMFDEELRLAAWNRNFQELLQLPEDFLAERHRFDDYIRYLTERGEFGETSPEVEIARLRGRLGDHYSFERTRPDGTVIEVRHNPMPDGGIVLIYSDITERKRSEAEIRAARDAAEAAYRDLKAAQASLIQAEKMASLGQLTAGIAHEIKNPLNFVNNFAGLSVELLDELKETAAPAITALGDEKRAEIDETIEMLTGNLEKIAEHGRRADGIVKSMLEHSRGSSGERRSVDLNDLIDEALNLAYHGGRAQDAGFNVTLERDFAHAIAPIELVPQDITRVCLNLFGNGFYATTKRQKEGSDPKFKPTLKVSTRDLGEAVEIRIYDNGTGISPEIKDKLFQPFFTTKPTGEGTGLGLSISYDILTQQHGGTITVDSRVGEFTEFTVRLPRAYRATIAEAAS
jgi:PAS domain S-box-containing protein